jgi:hypothetical protein
MSGKEQALKLPNDDVAELQLPTAKEETKPAKLVQGLDGDTLKLNFALARDALGSQDGGFIVGLFNQVLQMTNDGKGKPDEKQLDFIAGALCGIKPKDELEGMLVVQIIANQILSMKFAAMLCATNQIERQEAVERIYTRLARTTPALMDTLRSKRTGGRQRVKVEHVHVHNGGQAIVGNVETGGGGAERSGG